MFGQPPPTAGDYTQAAEKQAQSGTLANRPNQTNAFGSTVQWTQGPDGSWQQQQSFGGPLAGTAGGLQAQAAQSLGTPFDFGQFAPAGTGDSARDQAINAAYGQATSRLDPQWQQRESQMRTQLANQGLDPNSEAARNAMQQFGQQRNDAYGSAMNSAIGQGTAAGDSVFRNNMMARQNAVAEALQGRRMPLQEMGMMQGLLGQQGFQSGDPTQYLSALLGQDQASMNRYNMERQASADTIQGASQLISTLAGAGMMLSDQRAKHEITRYELELVPGVRLASWRYRPEFDPSQRFFIGVIAQDLEAVLPQFVHEREDGLKIIDYSFLRGDA